MANFRILACCLAALCVSMGGFAQQNASRPRVILIVCDALTFDDLHLNDNSRPNLADMAANGSIGLMNCAAAGPKTDTTALLTLAIGQMLPAEPTDELAFNDWELVPKDNDNARIVYLRRAGLLDPSVRLDAFDPARSVKHLGMAGLTKRGIEQSRLGALLARAQPPVRAWIAGNADTERPNRRGALLTVNGAGVGAGLVALARYDSHSPCGLADNPLSLAQYALEADADFLVLQLGDGARAEAARSRLSESAYRAAHDEAAARLDLLVLLLRKGLSAAGKQADILIVSPRPPAADAHSPAVWNRLTPLLAIGPDFPPGRLTSATTRTPGLVANTDIAPTLLTLFHLPIPSAMTGRPIQVEARRDEAASGTDPIENRKSKIENDPSLAAVARLDFVTTLNDAALTWIMVPLGGVCLLGLLGGLWARSRGGMAAARRFAPVSVFTLNLPAALLLAPLLIPPTLWEYGLRIVVWMTGLTALCYLQARYSKISPPLAACLLGTLLVVGDTLTGQQLLRDSLLCGYPLSGIRYYGIGNEYLGVLLGFALGGGFAWLDDQATIENQQSKIPFLLLPAVWIGLLLLLGLPGLGANAGSLVATGAGFGVGILLLRGSKVTFWRGAACALLGLLLAFAFSAYDALSAGKASSHSGEALIHAAGGQGAGYLLEIATRKVAMNLRLFLSPWFLLALAVFAGTLLLAYRLVGDTLRSLLAQRPWTRRGMQAVFAAALAALLFKDSGVVTVAFLGCIVLLITLHTLFTEDIGYNESAR